MHEYSIVQSLLGRVAQSARGYDVAAVRRLTVRIGALSGVDSELLRTAYELCAPGTLCAGAELVIRDVAARWRCPACERDAAAGERLACPACGGVVKLVEGDEIILDSVELEVKEETRNKKEEKRKKTEERRNEETKTQRT